MMKDKYKTPHNVKMTIHKALSLMDNSPSTVSKEQLNELYLAVINDSEE